MVSKTEDAAPSNPYENMLLDDKPAAKSWEATAPSTPSTEEAKPPSSSSYNFDSDVVTTLASTPATEPAPVSSSYNFDSDVATTELASTPAAEPATVAAPPAKEHVENPWGDLCSDSGHSSETQPVSTRTHSGSTIAGGEDDFAVWSAMKSLDSPAAWNSDSPAKKKETDWSSLVNGGLWGQSVTNHDPVPVTSAKQVPDTSSADAVDQMTRLLKENSLLQTSKKGMVSIKLYRGSQDR